jgi:hypothetical protein
MTSQRILYTAPFVRKFVFNYGKLNGKMSASWLKYWQPPFDSVESAPALRSAPALENTLRKDNV